MDLNGTPLPDGNTEYAGRIDSLTAQLKAAVDVMGEAKDTDAARWQKADEERQALAAQIGGLVERQAVAEREAATAKAVTDMQDFLQTVRAPSKAAAIGGNTPVQSGRQKSQQGRFLLGVALARSNDADEQAAGKAMLSEVGAEYQRAWGPGGTASGMDAALSGAKATLGTTDATGGWVMANASVADLIRTSPYDNPLRALITPVTGINTLSVDVPFRSAAVSRAVIAAWGDVKENRNLAYNGYTATMYTMALIYDLAKQYVRLSSGAAEQDVLATLAEAFALGERFYIMEGTGSSQPYGLLTALTNSPAAFTSTFTPSATTLAGSIAKAIATAAGDLGTRNRGPGGLAAVLSATDYWTMVSQGTDTAGFFFAPVNGPEGIRPGTLMTPWGIPVIPDPSMTSDRLVVGDFKALRVYYGETYRVDSSEVAGERWDRNLVGFRGEMEIGLDARPAVYSGAFQQITNVAP